MRLWRSGICSGVCSGVRGRLLEPIEQEARGASCIVVEPERPQEGDRGLSVRGLGGVVAADAGDLGQAQLGAPLHRPQATLLRARESLAERALGRAELLGSGVKRDEAER